MTTADAARFDHPLAERYASRVMVELFSPLRKHRTWRHLWIALAEAQRELGLDISAEQIAQLRKFRDDVDLARATQLERELRHDVMAHVHAYGEQAPDARPIIHLGATSCYVTDNTDLMLFREGLELITAGLVRTIDALARFARAHARLACLGYTHFQEAQPVTVGKRACLWIQDLVMDLSRVDREARELPFRGVKGTTGTQASFLALFGGDHAKVRELDRRVTERMGFAHALPVTGQTYSRKVDFHIASVLASVGQSCAKMAIDLRLLAHDGELDEPVEKSQIGSSAMAYKRNPMRSERITSLARYLQGLPAMMGETALNQWLERTLDDSAIRRIVMPQAFLAADACLILATNIASGLVVYPKVIARNLVAALPFMVTEEILMAGAQAGGDRQTLHERIRVHSREAARRIKEDGADNPLLAMIAADPAFAAIKDRLPSLADPARFIGRAPEQVVEFLDAVVEPVLQKHAHLATRGGGEVRV